MAARFGIPPADLRPWHFSDLFFQEAPDVQEVNLDDVLKDKDLIAMTKTYYESMGMEIDDIIARSDMYEKPGKSPHAFCTDIDRTGNAVRMLCNLKPNAYWADTIIHEMGHAVYCKYLGKELPFILHEESHAITTEGIAIMFGAMVKNEDFMRNVLKLSEDQIPKYVSAMHDSLRAEKLIFSRWTQVMMRFEHGMYGNPEQDLAKLWWDLKKRYQSMPPPDDATMPGFGAKVHVVTAPVYYHSYMMGDLFGCQIHAYVAKNALKIDDPAKTAFFGSKAAGDWLREKVFAPGNLYPWNELTKLATGEPLTAKYFARQYVQ
jgi:peptidyl-dipeptidase A